MADLLSGLALIEGFSRLLPAFLVLIMLYAALQYTKALGSNPTINILVSLVVSAIVLLSENISIALSFMAPWFVLLIIFLIFVMIVFKAIGVSDGQILNVLKQYKLIVWVIAFLCIAIAIVGLGNVLGQDLLEASSGAPRYVENLDGTYTTPDGRIIETLPPGVEADDFQSNVTTTLFHPTLLSFILIGLISAFSVYFMTRFN